MVPQATAPQQIFALAEIEFVKIVTKNYLKKSRFGSIMKVSA